MQSIECGNCAAACCSNIPISLNGGEAAFLRERGTRLRLHTSEVSRDHSKELYQMIGKCGWLDPTTNLCTAYDLERPDMCIRLRAGSTACAEIRVAKGVPTRVEIFEEASNGRAAINEISMGYLNDFDGPAVSTAVLAQLPDVTLADAYMLAAPTPGRL